jgi:hypothetical protein
VRACVPARKNDGRSGRATACVWGYATTRDASERSNNVQEIRSPLHVYGFVPSIQPAIWGLNNGASAHAAIFVRFLPESTTWCTHSRVNLQRAVDVILMSCACVHQHCERKRCNQSTRALKVHSAFWGALHHT